MFGSNISRRKKSTISISIAHTSLIINNIKAGR